MPHGGSVPCAPWCAGGWCRSGATPAGKTPREAADIIIAQSEQLRGALSQLGVLRMRKYEVMQAADLGKAQAVADEVLAAIAAIGQAL